MSSTDAEYTRRLQRLSASVGSGTSPIRTPGTSAVWRRVVCSMSVAGSVDASTSFGHGVSVSTRTRPRLRCARENGHEAYTPEEFAAAVLPAGFAVRHAAVLARARASRRADRSRFASRGIHAVPSRRCTVVIITPQERGQRSDATHVRFMDDAALTALADKCGLVDRQDVVVPAAALFGRWFIYNETVTVARVKPR